MRRVVLLILVLLLLGLAVASAAPVVTANSQTYCRCVWIDDQWCYRCCDYTGCLNLYCGATCP